MRELREGGVRGAERKLVTALFCDIVGSTSLGERLDPELLETVQKTYFERMQAVVERFGGSVQKFIGDAVVAVFGVPRSHEDDAVRAVRCAFAMREAIRSLNDALRPRFDVELEIRIGIDTGEAIAVSSEHGLATGDVMNTAARLQQAAEPGEILVGREAMRLTRDLVDYAEPGRIAAKGKAAPVEVWSPLLLAEERRRPRPPFIGRVHELQRLTAAVERAIRDREPQLVAVIGEPGIGKSRLAEEFSARTTDRAAVYRGACLPYGEGTTWLPFPAIVKAEVAILDSDAEDVALAKLQERLSRRHPLEEVPLVAGQLGPLVGAKRASAGSGSELLWSLRRYFEALARERPAVLILDDLHWASEPVMETLEELADTLAAVPLLLVCQGRPEVAERLGRLLVGDRIAVITVEALSEQDAGDLLAALAADGELGTAVLARAGGNPLFIEELAALAAEEGVSGRVPTSVRALIAARLDLLAPEAKRVAQAAATVGDVFWDEALGGLPGGDVSVTVGSELRALRRRGLVDEEPASSFTGSRQFRFHHALIREVAYESLAKVERARLHRLAGRWLEERAETRPELLGAIAHHFDSALALEAEVAPLEPPEPALVETTVASLLAAGEWATANAALSEAVRLFRRAGDVSAGRANLQERSNAHLAVALVRSGAEAKAVEVAEAVLAATTAPEAIALASFALAEAARNEARGEEIRSHAERAREVARAAGLAAVESQAHHLLGWHCFWAGEVLEAEVHQLHASEIALELGDKGLAAWALAYAGDMAMWRGELELANDRIQRAMQLARESGSVRAIAAGHVTLSRVRRAQDRGEEAVKLGREGARLFLEVEERFFAATMYPFAIAEPLIDRGLLDEAWASLEQGLEIARPLHSAAVEGPIRIRRAQVLLAWGRPEEAEAELKAVTPERGFGQDDAQAVLAEVRAAQGQDGEAERLWRELFARLPEQQNLDRAELQLPFATFLATRRRDQEAQVVLANVRSIIAEAGAALLERQAAEVEALLDQH